MKQNKNYIMIAGTRSGSGKTTITCGILQMMVNQGLMVASLKCGPDYIDPMFHEKVVGIRSGNLDSFFMNKETLCTLLKKHSAQKDITVLEGVMGYYDGIGNTLLGSSYEVSRKTNTPVILVLDCNGMGASIGAMLHGFVTYQKNPIRGVIFNQLPPSLYEDMKQVANQLGIQPCGYVPTLGEFHLKSRHLGLVTADEISSIQEQLQKLARKMSETIDINSIVSIAKKGILEDIGADIEEQEERLSNHALSNFELSEQGKLGQNLRIAVAKDEAFCFIYRDNIELLEEFGCEIIYFSPLRDHSVPDNIDGMLLYGGYPELYAKELSKNNSMRTSIKETITHKIPTIAECGGFLYLHDSLEDIHGTYYPMVGVIHGKAYKTKGLRRFGYITLQSNKDSLLAKKGEKIKAHEFHYWESSSLGCDFTAKKEGKDINWDCIHSNETLHTGFPHIHFYTAPWIVKRFLLTCQERKETSSM